MSGNYFSKKEINRNPSINSCNASRSSCVSMCVLNEVLKYCLVLCTSYVFIDASTKEYEEEEAYAEEEEHFDNCTNQGKLIPMQALLVQAIP